MNLSLRDQIIENVAATLRQSSVKTNPRNWPSLSEYRNSESGHFYKPHHEIERIALLDLAHRYILCKGGEGGGKSVFGIMRDFEAARMGCHGIIVSPDLPHFSRSLWPEFRRWCPWDCVVPQHRRMESPAWFPSSNFELVFTSGAVMYMGGASEADPKAQEGANVTYAHYDEARRHNTPVIFKTLDGRVRVPMPDRVPQIWITTTPFMNWLYDYFGPLKPGDPMKAFKERSHVLTLLTQDNESNLAEGFVDSRRSVLTEAEARVLLNAEWEDIASSDKFLGSMELWDRLKVSLPVLKKEPLVVAVDAGMKSDNFGIVGVSRHWERHNECAIRFVMKWEPHGSEIDFDGTEEEPGPFRVLKMLRENYNLILCTYDPHEMFYLAARMKKEAPVWLKEFSQQGRREEADRFLYDMIINKQVWHDGDPALREHINNCNRKLTQEESKMRIVKRSPNDKIDLAVALSMAVYECMRINI
jgi:hypothetical protein